MIWVAFVVGVVVGTFGGMLVLGLLRGIAAARAAQSEQVTDCKSAEKLFERPKVCRPL